MDVRDLGALQGKMVVYGGPYSNLQASLALLSFCADNRIPASHRICTGDTVAYGGEPKATWSLMRTTGGTVVAGNCERNLAENAEDCGCGFGADTTCDLLSRAWYAYARRELPQDAKDWMAALPDMVVFQHGTRRCAVIHGGLSDISRFLWPSSPEADFSEEIALIEAAVGAVDVVFAGHCGLAFQRQIGDALWVNAGAIGLPPNDGRPETRFALLDGDKITIERLDYNARPAISAMTRAGLTQGYHDTLKTGLWPSEDVLPTELRRAG
ncbi:putative phosphatase [Dinoroseobacter shibae DFL 12 = DSM 16493]|jgi:predicted phosphodiesterase|uniref:Putative phosphatase n=1 Tax=Dinoroseobacter shibae (strain DSM 16493 / NCIMB 14021 / DFL 12) TaxID=398580 RepID=A8LKZ0_DINSH|nr:metallophosphoesterase family protein [Dinoroseobacter shibae]ABV93354.1 putative phosphatase [Dinoroseobacter shibae DFL 12 = DSM 16493]URF48270.1 metallophosphoesterase family protein [Dinoroseobacter shibae]URF52580.1 metallophosphoesterase family protein [Dinoroseobacter shibae]